MILWRTDGNYVKKYLIIWSTIKVSWVRICSRNAITEQSLTCLAMTQGFEHNSYELYIDNYYSSPKLFCELKAHGKGAAGTLKHNRKYMPSDFVQSGVLALNKDDPVFMQCDDLITCAIIDTKRVHFLSSIHSDNTLEKTVPDRKANGGTRTVIR